MGDFVGWSPTILGRVSFSRIGEAVVGGSVTCNATDTSGFLFGVSRRTSHDGPLPAWLTNLIGRYPYTDWAFFLECRPGELPFLKTSCSDASSSDTDVVLRSDDRAELVGSLYFANGATNALGAAAHAAFADCRDNAWIASGATASDQVQLELFHRTRDGLEEAFDALKRANLGEEPTPIFGKVDVVFSRSGMCKLSVDPAQLLTTGHLKQMAREGRTDDYDREAVQVHLEDVAAQAFFVIRDLTHQHYHHKKHSDLLTTVTPWTQETDEDWRRQTQYGLARMAIAVRRSGRAESFRQALGIVAYAQAFQNHLCGWFSPEPGKVRKSAVSFNYDFAALKASIEASLKVRELKDSNRRARMFFAFGTAVTALSILTPAYRGNEEHLGQWPGYFRDALALAVDNPIPTLAVAAMIGFAVDHAILTFSVNQEWFEKSRASVSRLVGGFMGMLRRHRVPARAAQVSALMVLAIVLIAALLLTYLGYRYAFEAIGQMASQFQAAPRV
ncbi:hypothetical protein D3C85_877140 [compost metagenome]